MSENDRSRLYAWLCEHADEQVAEYMMSCLPVAPVADLVTKQHLETVLSAEFSKFALIIAAQREADRMEHAAQREADRAEQTAQREADRAEQAAQREADRAEDLASVSGGLMRTLYRTDGRACRRHVRRRRYHLRSQLRAPSPDRPLISRRGGARADPQPRARPESRSCECRRALSAAVAARCG